MNTHAGTITAAIATTMACGVAAEDVEIVGDVRDASGGGGGVEADIAVFATETSVIAAVASLTASSPLVDVAKHMALELRKKAKDATATGLLQKLVDDGVSSLDGVDIVRGSMDIGPGGRFLALPTHRWKMDEEPCAPKAVDSVGNVDGTISASPTSPITNAKDQTQIPDRRGLFKGAVFLGEHAGWGASQNGAVGGGASGIAWGGITPTATKAFTFSAWVHLYGPAPSNVVTDMDTYLDGMPAGGTIFELAHGSKALTFKFSSTQCSPAAAGSGGGCFVLEQAGATKKCVAKYALKQCGPAVGKFCHVAVRLGKETERVTIFVNGVAIDDNPEYPRVTCDADPTTGTTDIALDDPGMAYTGFTSGFDGLLRDVRFFGAALLPHQVASLAAVTHPRFVSDRKLTPKLKASGWFEKKFKMTSVDHNSALTAWDTTAMNPHLPDKHLDYRRSRVFVGGRFNREAPPSRYTNACGQAASHHLLLVGSPSRFKQHAKGNKPAECARDDARTSVGSHEVHGNHIHVTCCNARGRASRACNADGDGPLLWDVPFVVAQKFCEAEGLRLCTADELAAGVAHQGGCRGDPHMTWTATPCVPFGHHRIVVGKPAAFTAHKTGRKQPECRPPLAKHSVALNKPTRQQLEVTLKTGGDLGAGDCAPGNNVRMPPSGALIAKGVVKKKNGAQKCRVTVTQGNFRKNKNVKINGNVYNGPNKVSKLLNPTLDLYGGNHIGITCCAANDGTSTPMRPKAGGKCINKRNYFEAVKLCHNKGESLSNVYPNGLTLCATAAGAPDDKISNGLTACARRWNPMSQWTADTCTPDTDKFHRLVVGAPDQWEEHPVCSGTGADPNPEFNMPPECGENHQTRSLSWSNGCLEPSLTRNNDRIKLTCCSGSGGSVTQYRPVYKKNGSGDLNAPGWAKVNNLGTCLRHLTYDTAVQACSLSGGRLCTETELRTVATASGCGANYAMVWTSNKCAPFTVPLQTTAGNSFMDGATALDSAAALKGFFAGALGLEEKDVNVLDNSRRRRRQRRELDYSYSYDDYSGNYDVRLRSLCLLAPLIIFVLLLTCTACAPFRFFLSTR